MTTSPNHASYDPLTEHLITEARDVGRDIRRLVGDQVRFLTLGFTVVGAIAAFIARASATSQGAPGQSATIQSPDETLIARMLLPLAVGGVVAYALLLGAEIMALGGYKRRIEEVVNDRVDAPLMQWESVIAPRVTARPIARTLFYGAIGALLIAFLADGISVLTLTGDGSRELHVVSWAAVASYIYGTALLTVALLNVLRAAPKAYALASLRPFPSLPKERASRARWWWL
jgi:hypothetical protein